MDKTITFTVNGQRRAVTTDPERPLLEVLREDLQLTGAKYACGEGQCGACTVLVNGQTVLSCTTPVADLEGKSILTIEGLAKGTTLHPVQEAFLAEDAFQCGYCTPGMILATVALLEAKPNPSEAEVQARFQGHICRCCGYPRILKAVRRAAADARRQTR
jgi:aerobic-type carbon monoxide dehydrogenase small subunit (CoxS/CutS family)